LSTLSLLYYLAVFLWLAYLPVAVVFLKGWINNRKSYVNTNLTRIHNDPFINFQIMTRSARASDVVRRGIESINSSCKQIAYSDYSICVVTEDPLDLSYVSGARVLVVPREYKTEKGAIRKARAMQYAIEVRRSEGDDAKRKWIFHMDEESVVTKQTVLSLLAFIREGKGLLSEGPIAYPLKMNQSNRIAFLTDSIRPFQCYDCVSYMNHPPPMYMHGSNLLVRSDVEDRVGWDHGKSLAEDQLFGVKAHEMFGNIFGWHGGILLEQPPLTLRDHFRQRKRWIFGTLQNLKYLPTKMKLRIYLRSATTWLGFLSALASIGLSIYYLYLYALPYLFHLAKINYRIDNQGVVSLVASPQQVALFLQSFATGRYVFSWSSMISGLTTLFFGASLILASVIWAVSYQVGLKQNLKFGSYTMRERVSLHAQQLVLGPLIGFIETFPSLYAIIEYHIFRKKFADFELIAK
jgi:egghead protein (zeste-white 4 protein)